MFGGASLPVPSQSLGLIQEILNPLRFHCRLMSAHNPPPGGNCENAKNECANKQAPAQPPEGVCGVRSLVDSFGDLSVPMLAERATTVNQFSGTAWRRVRMPISGAASAAERHDTHREASLPLVRSACQIHAHKDETAAFVRNFGPRQAEACTPTTGLPCGNSARLAVLFHASGTAPPF